MSEADLEAHLQQECEAIAAGVEADRSDFGPSPLLPMLREFLGCPVVYVDLPARWQGLIVSHTLEEEAAQRGVLLID